MYARQIPAYHSWELVSHVDYIRLCKLKRVRFIAYERVQSPREF